VPRSADGQCYRGVSRDGLARSDADLLCGRMVFAGYLADVVHEQLFGSIQHLPDNTFEWLKFENRHIKPRQNQA